MTIAERAVVVGAVRYLHFLFLSTQKFVSLNKQTKLHSLYRSSKPLTYVVFLYEQQQGRLFTDDAVGDAGVAWVVQCCGFSCSQLSDFILTEHQMSSDCLLFTKKRRYLLYSQLPVLILLYYRQLRLTRDGV